MDSTANVPAQIQAEAKARALAILATEPGCISYVRPEDLETAALFIPVVSIIKPVPEDFHPSIPGIGILPKVPLQNTIREKAGVSILRTETSKRSEYVWVAHCWGEKRMPDGTMSPDDGSYEYDAEKRAELDFINQPDKYKSDIAKRKHILENCKFAESKAVTGAQWVVIKKLAKVAASFKTPEELMRGMKLLRIDRNVNGIMADPTMREAVIQHALGASEQVFGPAKQIARTYDAESGEKLEQEPAAAEPGQEDLFDDTPAADPTPEKTAAEKARDALEGYRGSLKGSPKATKLLDDTLAKKDVTEQEISLVIDRFEQYLQKARTA